VQGWIAADDGLAAAAGKRWDVTTSSGLGRIVSDWLQPANRSPNLRRFGVLNAISVNAQDWRRSAAAATRFGASELSGTVAPQSNVTPTHDGVGSAHSNLGGTS